MSGYTSIVDTKPMFVPGTFDAQDVRLATVGNASPGLFASGDFAVTQRAAGANMSVDIAAGRAYVNPGAVARQGSYVAWWETTFNTLSNGGYTWTAADPTNPRIDLLCIEAADTDFGGSFTGWKWRIVDGTPNAGATAATKREYWPAIPSGCLAVAAIRIPAAATTITTANIYNLDEVGGPGGGLRLVRETRITASGTYYPPANARALEVTCVGGGGGGGGCAATAAGQAATGGGGGSGSMARVLLTSGLKTNYTVAVGAAGTAGVAGNNAGGNGGATTFDSASVCTGNGGTGGSGGAAQTPPQAGGQGGAGGTASGVGDITFPGARGQAGSNINVGGMSGGGGGVGPFGGGAAGSVGGAGGAATANSGAGGGGGAASNGTGAQAGGAGGSGIIIVREYV